MKIYKYFFIFLLAGAVTNNINGQTVLNAFIIKLNGDTTKGSLQLYGNKFGKNILEKLGDFVTFKEPNGDFKDYKPTELIGFGFYYTDKKTPENYASEVFGNKKRFLKILLDGPLRMYANHYLTTAGMHTVGATTHYIKKKGAELVELDDRWYYKQKSRGPLREYLSDCPILEQELSAKEITDEGMMAIFRKYNEWYTKTKNLTKS